MKGISVIVPVYNGAAMLDACVRDELGNTSPRVMAVLDPIKVVLINAEETWQDVPCSILRYF